VIPYGRQDIRQEDVDAVVSALRSDFLTQGPLAPQLESAISRKVGASYAVALNSATSALHVACLALGLGPGDRLWTSPITFVASANCALYCGAEVDFVDIDARTYNICPQALAEKLERAEREGRLPKVVVPVHLCGQSCDMVAIDALAQKYGFRVIEDASHAIGGAYLGAAVGNCRYSDITIFSFHPVKIITMAEGGMAMTNQPDLAERMALLRSHGITRDEKLMTCASHGPWYYQQIALGFNFRLTELQAALGLSQLPRLDEYVAKRHAIARRYDEALAELPMLAPWQNPQTYSAYHLYVVRLQSVEGLRARKRRDVVESLRNDGIAVNVHYIPVHTQPYYKKLGFREGDYPEAERYYSEALSLPMFPTLTDAEQETVVDRLALAVRA
jgi:UDP-4-amino-4,6-dideoxy-N-acetyl-beta-L-altrosamine transaminase